MFRFTLLEIVTLKCSRAKQNKDEQWLYLAKTLCFAYNLIDQIIDFFSSKVEQSLMREHNSL